MIFFRSPSQHAELADMIRGGSNIGGGEVEVGNGLVSSDLEEFKMPYNVNYPYFVHSIPLSKCWCDLIFLICFYCSGLMGRRRTHNFGKNTRLPAHQRSFLTNVRRIHHRRTLKEARWRPCGAFSPRAPLGI